MKAKRTQTLSFEGALMAIKVDGYGKENGSGDLTIYEDDLEFLTGEDQGYVNLSIPHSELIALRDHLNEHLPKFEKTYCSNCGKEFGPGDHGYSHCENHAGVTPVLDR